MQNYKIDLLMKNKLFVDNLNKILILEKEREFCRHNLQHLLDVARICYILVLETGLEYDKEIIYALALLHDIGRAVQYETGENHDKAGSRLASQIMSEVGFQQKDIDTVCGIILKHRGNEHHDCEGLESVFCKADYLSRNCMYCSVIDKCKWVVKNLILSY